MATRFFKQAQKFKIVSIAPQYVEAASSLVGISFGLDKTRSIESNDPFSLGLGLTTREWHDMSYSFLVSSLLNQHVNMTKIAIDIESGRVVGIIPCDDWMAPIKLESSNEIQIPDIPTQFFPMVEMFRQLNNKYVSDHPKVESGSVLRLSYSICVDRGERNKGVLAQLAGATLSHARDLGYSQVAAYAATERSRRVLGALGFNEIHNLPFADFEYENSKVFATLPRIDGLEFSRLSLMRRHLPNNMYV